jgi:hypothetical protein
MSKTISALKRCAFFALNTPRKISGVPRACIFNGRHMHVCRPAINFQHFVGYAVKYMSVVGDEKKPTAVLRQPFF